MAPRNHDIRQQHLLACRRLLCRPLFLALGCLGTGTNEKDALAKNSRKSITEKWKLPDHLFPHSERSLSNDTAGREEVYLSLTGIETVSST
ncbi:unnamed protein product [Spirodela intermedia]|uniref:Uncharacterized protein n=1 Tax=Spirodela intermedia TaxID=51605 RepID=A0A7I8J8H2_SPIIN|nr:unnamed protein product [Spirodela intermedia]CAA6666467.1 unnamed protein product [Spirodela intermedia]